MNIQVIQKSKTLLSVLGLIQNDIEVSFLGVTAFIMTSSTLEGKLKSVSVCFKNSSDENYIGIGNAFNDFSQAANYFDCEIKKTLIATARGCIFGYSVSDSNEPTKTAVCSK